MPLCPGCGTMLIIDTVGADPRMPAETSEDFVISPIQPRVMLQSTAAADEPRRESSPQATPAKSQGATPAHALKFMAAGGLLTGIPLLIALVLVTSRMGHVVEVSRQTEMGTVQALVPAARGTQSVTTSAALMSPASQISQPETAPADVTSEAAPVRAKVEPADSAPPATLPALDPIPIVKGPTTLPKPPEPVLSPADVAHESLASAATEKKNEVPRHVETVAVAPPVPLKPKVVPVRPLLRPQPPERGDLTDEDIQKAIEKGVSSFLADWDPIKGPPRNRYKDPGVYTLVLYSLLQAGFAIHDPRLGPLGDVTKPAIAYLKSLSFKGSETYSTGIRATGLAVFNRKEDRAILQRDVNALVEGHNDGGYTYALHPGMHWDNSNSQYGLLGVWSGADAGVDVPREYWEAVEKHWISSQLKNGQWGYYNDGGGTQTMTAAGIASLFVTRDHLNDDTETRIPVGRPPFSPPLQRGLDWWEQGNNSITGFAAFSGYGMYGVERVGLASGFKYFGKHDWYRVLAQKIISTQDLGGSWGDDVESAYRLLFLSRGRHPILMNKLRFDGYWANRPRDVAYLSRFVSHEFERPLNWQIVDLNHGWWDWLDSPILYIASHRAPAFNDEQYDKLRSFVEGGGLIFTQADAGSQDFNDFADRFAHKLFPKYEFSKVPAGHVLSTSPYKVKNMPELKMVNNGSRILMLHSPTDVSSFWRQRADMPVDYLRFGANLFAYAAGKRDLRNRLDSPYVSPIAPSAPPPANGYTKIALLEYAADWDPEPGAWRRFAPMFQNRTGTGIKWVKQKWAELKPDTAPLAHLTGNATYRPTEAEIAALRMYVESGGVLVIDDCGGSGAFHLSIQEALLKAFSRSPLEPLDTGHPLLNAGPPGMADLRKPLSRPFAQDKKMGGVPLQLLTAGNGHVILSRLDIVTGLLGANTDGIVGYAPKYCDRLMQNAIFWTMDGQPDSVAATQPTEDARN